MTKRATKKQIELLQYIDGFIKGNGYGPSYREIMRALDYKSVSTVATHVDGLVVAGYLKKTGQTARSLEVVQTQTSSQSAKSQHKDWLTRELRDRLVKADISEADRQVLTRTAELFNISL